jgi:hypothetical protein
MGKVLPIPTKQNRRKALLHARALFTLHTIQTLGMYTTPWWMPWWLILAMFLYIFWLNRKHRGCPWTREEYQLRRQAGQKRRSHALIARLLAFPVNIWRPEERRTYPPTRTVNTVLYVSAVCIVGLALYLQGV